MNGGGGEEDIGERSGWRAQYARRGREKPGLML